MIGRLGRIWLVLGFAFLYAPILSLIVFSFNDSPLLAVWGGLSLRWYRALLGDQALQSAVWVSLKIAFFSASTALVLGTMAAFAISRYRRFFGRTAFLAHINAPLVVPEVITGLSLLLFFVACENFFGGASLRGLLAIWIGHTSICMAYATVVIQARLSAVDRAVEEAAMDLGCRPFQVFYLITLPAITQSLASAWLLTFTISLDDVVSTQFLMLPGTTTLPVLIFARARLGLDPMINAVATITVLIVGAIVATASLLLVRQEQLRAQAQAAAYRGAMLAQQAR